MKTMIQRNLLVGSIAALIFCFLVPLAALGQTEKLGDITYTPVKGWRKTSKENIVTFSELDTAAGKFCTITLYGLTAGTANAQNDFKREWNNLVVKPFGGEPNPKTETEMVDGWTAIAGGTAIDISGTKAVAFLTVLSRAGKTISILGMFNDEAYLTRLVAFSSSLDIEKPPAAAPPQTVNGRLVIPLPTRQLTIADLAGQWGQSDGINTRYVYRDSGTYAGSDSLHFKSKMTLTAAGGFLDDFYAIQNGKMIKEKTAGSFAINGRILVIKQRNIAKYVIRGWLELPDMTILEICGPWYDDDAIPEAIFTNPQQGANLDKKWVRTK
jgi:hypothetical protein